MCSVLHMLTWVVVYQKMCVLHHSSTVLGTFSDKFYNQTDLFFNTYIKIKKIFANTVITFSILEINTVQFCSNIQITNPACNWW